MESCKIVLPYRCKKECLTECVSKFKKTPIYQDGDYFYFKKTAPKKVIDKDSEIETFSKKYNLSASKKAKLADVPCIDAYADLCTKRKETFAEKQRAKKEAAEAAEAAKAAKVQEETVIKFVPPAPAKPAPKKRTGKKAQ